MSKIKKFLSLTVLVIGGLVVGLLPTYFSVAQNYGIMENSIFSGLFRFKMPNNSVYLYSMTEPNTYTIYFDGNGNTAGSMNSLDMTYDQKKNLLPNNFTKDGANFKGRSSSQTGIVEYLDQSEVENLTTENSGVVILYAQRETEVPYTVYYYQENIAGTGYDLVETGIMYGIEGTPAPQTSLVTYTGFTLRTGEQISINPDLPVPYYYDRNSYNLIVKDRDNILINTGIKFGADIPLPSNPEWTGNTFSGWNNVPLDGKMPANNLEITSTWTYGIHTITFNTDGGSEIDPITKNYGETIENPGLPTREGYEFVGWSPELPTTMPYDDITVTAIWKEIKKDSGTGPSGRGRTGGTPDTSEGDNEHGTAEGIGNLADRSELEIRAAYMRAYRKGIIGTGWQESDPDGYVTRGDMAEMVVKFTENVLGRQIPSIPAKCKRGDSEFEWKSAKAKTYAEKACALGVMGIRMENFMPSKYLDRAEFGTILSRLLWGDKYDIVNATRRNPYYTRHLNALNKAGIMKQIDNPESRYELRKRAWIMLMRVRE